MITLPPHLAKDPNSDRPPRTREEIHARTLWKINKYRFFNRHFKTELSPKEYAIRLFACEMAENPTPIERTVSDVLNRMDLYNRDQYIIDDKYIVDFILRDGKTIVECDGYQFHQMPNEIRDEYLLKQGYRVLHLNGRTCKDESAVWSAVDNFYEDREMRLAYR